MNEDCGSIIMNLSMIAAARSSAIEGPLVTDAGGVAGGETRLAVMDAETRKKVADALMRRAESLVRGLREASEANQEPSRIETLVDQLNDVLKQPGFPAQRATEFRDLGRGVALNSRRLAMETMFGKAELAARDGDEKVRNDLLTLAKEHYGKALRHGADEKFRDAVERRVQMILQTTKEGVDDRTKAAAKRKLDEREGRNSKAPGGRERRRAIRYVSPQFQLLVENARYTTINWSTRGLAIGPYRGELGVREGDRVRIEIACAEVAAQGRVVATVVRILPERSFFAVEFPDICTVVLEIAHQLKSKGIIPDPE